MRRSDKEIRDPELISRIIGMCRVCRLGLAKDNVPYILPVSFGYDGTALYIHTAKSGRKIEFFEANPTVCLEFEHGVKLKPHEHDPCSWSFSYQSVIGYGVISELTDPAEAIAAMHLIMRTYSEQDWSFTRESVAALRVWKISIESLSGKQSKDMVMS
jgi:nitroimidazol reductase NimA-like FMN-containing flavoprotein (pyridoxamine 5'-phosphate oxidase superfamily)